MRSTVTSTFAKIIAIIEDENLTKEGREKKRDVYDMDGYVTKKSKQERKPVTFLSVTFCKFGATPIETENTPGFISQLISFY